MTSLPDERGRFGQFGGKYVPEVLMGPLAELEEAFAQAWSDAAFRARLDDLLRQYAGRPTPLYFAEGLTRHCGGARIYLKREDLLHTGAHKINNALAQGLLCQRMGKKRVIAETGAGQHGVATATVCAMLGLDCVVYMGEEDVRRQMLNVFRMRLLGAEVRVVESGSRTLKDAINEAMRDWVANVGEHLLPARQRRRAAPLPAHRARGAVGHRRRDAGAGAGADSGVCPTISSPASAAAATPSASSTPSSTTPPSASSASKRRDADSTAAFTRRASCEGAPACFTAAIRTCCRTRTARSNRRTASRPGSTTRASGRSTASTRVSERAGYVAVTDEDALAAFELLSRTDGIIPALESAHAVAYAVEAGVDAAARSDRSSVCLSGRGDKDMETASKALDITIQQ